MHYRRDEIEIETTVMLIKKRPDLIPDLLECNGCGAPTFFLPMRLAVRATGIQADRLHVLIEGGTLHSSPISDGELGICCASLAAVLNTQTKNT